MCGRHLYIIFLYKLDVHNDTYKSSDYILCWLDFFSRIFQVSIRSQTLRCVKKMIQEKKRPITKHINMVDVRAFSLLVSAGFLFFCVSE